MLDFNLSRLVGVVSDAFEDRRVLVEHGIGPVRRGEVELGEFPVRSQRRPPKRGRRHPHVRLEALISHMTIVEIEVHSERLGGLAQRLVPVLEVADAVAQQVRPPGQQVGNVDQHILRAEHVATNPAVEVGGDDSGHGAQGIGVALVPQAARLLLLPRQKGAGTVEELAEGRLLHVLIGAADEQRGSRPS